MLAARSCEREQPKRTPTDADDEWDLAKELRGQGDALPPRLAARENRAERMRATPA